MEKKETFTQQVKEEIAQIHFSNDNLLAILSGFIKVNGSLSFFNKHTSIILKTEISKVARLIYNALKDLFHINPIFRYSKKIKLNKNVTYYILIEEEVEKILDCLELKDGLFSTFPKKLSHGKNMRFFLVGVFLASGSINSPLSSNYHLQIALSEKEDALKILKLFNHYKGDNSMNFKMLEHHNKYLLYLKKADQISTFLSLVCAQDSLFEYEHIRIEKDFLNSGNRLDNCVVANYNRTVKKSNEQMKDINFIIQNSNLVILSEKERALCELRLKNQDYSLKELADLLYEEYNIKISKSGVYHLFQSIHEKVEKLQNE